MGWTIRGSTSGTSKKYFLRNVKPTVGSTQDPNQYVPRGFSPEAKPVPESDSKTEKTLHLSTSNIHNQNVRGHNQSVLHQCGVFNTALPSSYVLRNAKTKPRALRFFLTTQPVTLVITNLRAADSGGRRVFKDISDVIPRAPVIYVT
jgi:hypothetical protein